MNAPAVSTRWYLSHPGARCSCPTCVTAYPTPSDRCNTYLPFHSRCLRALTDPCDACKLFDAHAAEWAAAFNEYRSPPRKAIEGDIL